MIDGKNDEGQCGAHTRRTLIVGLTAVAGGLVLTSRATAAGATDEEISSTAEAIHQEPAFKTSPNRIYTLLLDPKQFDKVVQISGVMKTMSVESKPTQISSELGGAFSLFGGYVTGRHIELVQNTRIVQAWRAGSWDPGVYSIARFELAAQGSGTKIIFDHTGFPKGAAEHLAAGWKVNYWEPMQKFLAL